MPTAIAERFSEYEKARSTVAVWYMEKPSQCLAVRWTYLMECSMECPMEHSMERSMERSMDCPMERSMECSMECSMDCPMERSMGCSMGRSLESPTSDGVAGREGSLDGSQDGTIDGRNDRWRTLCRVEWICIGHRRRRVYRAGIDVPVRKMTASAESFPTARGPWPNASCVYAHVYTRSSTGSMEDGST